MNEANPGAQRGLFVLFYTRGANWIPGKSLHEQPLAGHVEYLERLAREGVVALAGPFVDAESGGMAIINAPDISRAVELAEADPAVKQEVMAVRARAWAVFIESST